MEIRARGLALLLSLLGGCADQQRPIAPTGGPAAPAGRALWFFPGIQGYRFIWDGALSALREGGFEGEIHFFDWGRPLRSLDNLTELDENQQKCAAVARQIERFHRDNPHATIDLLAYSAGAGMALWTAERLPPEMRIRRIILIQPAVSPDFDLEPALRHVDETLTCFLSANDTVILGWGTGTFGTVDRVNGPAAGKDGFNLARAARDADLRARIVEVQWTPEMRAMGHWGNHNSMISPEWNRRFVAPLLTSPQPFQQKTGSESAPAATAR